MAGPGARPGGRMRQNFAIADLTLAARLLLAAVFGVAGVAKLIDRGGARAAVAALGVGRGAAAPVAAVLPFGELAVAVALANRTTAVAGAVGALALLVVFAGAIGLSLARGRQPDCRCFGRLHPAPIGWKTFARNTALAAIAAFAAAEGPGTGLGAWASGVTGFQWAALLVAVALAVAFALEGSLLLGRWRQQGRRR